MTEEMGFYIFLYAVLEIFLPLVLIAGGAASVLLMLYAGRKDEKKAFARTEYGAETHKYYAAEYSKLYRWSRAVALFYLCCLLLPVIPAIFIDVFELSFIKAWQGYLIFAVLGLAAEIWILKKGCEDIAYVTVGNSGLKAVYRDGNERIYSLTRFERYEKRRHRSGLSEVLIFRGDEKDEQLRIDELGEESADRIYQDIKIILRYGYFPQQQKPKPMQNQGQPYQQAQDKQQPQNPYSKEAQKAAIAATTQKQADIRSNPAEFEKYLKKTAKKLRADEKKEILNLIHSGRKIEAIKNVREITGIGLADAKEIVDHYETMLEWVSE